MEYEEISRDTQLKELRNFVESTDEYLNKLLTCFGWNKNSIQDVEPTIICPFDASHHLLEKGLEQHLEKCQWKAEGYGETDLPLSIPPTLPNKRPCCITFDEQLQEDVLQLAKLEYPSIKLGTSGRLIPRTSDRLIAEFTTEERKLLYEYAVSNTVQPYIGEDVADLNKPQKSDENKTSSCLELLLHERNLRRRRAKHRGVHTNKKSQIEICREVINQQMEMLAEYITEKNYCKTAQALYSESHSSEGLKVNNKTNYERKKSSENKNDDYSDYHSHNHRSRRSNDDYYDGHSKKNMLIYSSDERKHSKHRRKSSKYHRRQDPDFEVPKHKRKHKRHHSKHRHREKDGRRSHERDSSRHSKKSKRDDKKKDERKN